MTTKDISLRHQVTSYAVGFSLSLLLTVIPYWLVVAHILHGNNLVIALILFALAQLFVQLRYFLHVGRGANKQWNIIALVFMLTVVIIVVVGSLWIMNNLNYNMMSPHQMNEYMMKEVNKGF